MHQGVLTGVRCVTGLAKTFACVVAVVVALCLSTGNAGALDRTNPGCGGAEVPCEITGGAGGRYYVAPPPDWDGKRPLGALLFFHGYKSSGKDFITYPGVLAAAHRGGYLLVTPDGLNGTWAHNGSPSHARDEIAYVKGILADLDKRFAIDAGNIWAAGFSQGASMTWDVACYMGDRFKAIVPIAGAFWVPLPESCPAGPVNILHIHGTKDPTVPMAGRAIGSSFRQGDVMKSWSVMKSRDQCKAAPSQAAQTGAFRCEMWTDCVSQHRLEMCLHPGGHEIPRGWADLAYDFLSSLKK